MYYSALQNLEGVAADYCKLRIIIGCVDLRYIIVPASAYLVPAPFFNPLAVVVVVVAIAPTRRIFRAVFSRLGGIFEIRDFGSLASLAGCFGVPHLCSQQAALDKPPFAFFPSFSTLSSPLLLHPFLSSPSSPVVVNSRHSRPSHRQLEHLLVFHARAQSLRALSLQVPAKIPLLWFCP